MAWTGYGWDGGMPEAIFAAHVAPYVGVVESFESPTDFPLTVLSASTVQVGTGWSCAGGVAVNNSAADTVTGIPAATSGTRTDWIAIRRDWSQSFDAASGTPGGTVSLARLPGDASGQPTGQQTALGVKYDQLLGSITVGTNGVQSVSTTARSFAGSSRYSTAANLSPHAGDLMIDAAGRLFGGVITGGSAAWQRLNARSGVIARQAAPLANRNTWYSSSFLHSQLVIGDVDYPRRIAIRATVSTSVQPVTTWQAQLGWDQSTTPSPLVSPANAIDGAYLHTPDGVSSALYQTRTLFGTFDLPAGKPATVRVLLAKQGGGNVYLLNNYGPVLEALYTEII